MSPDNVQSWQSFVSNVGIPFSVLILFVGPFMYLVFRFLSKWGDRIAQGHVDFMTTSKETQTRNTECQQQNTELLASIAQRHQQTHSALSLHASATIDILDDRKESARRKLEEVGEVLKAS